MDIYKSMIEIEIRAKIDNPEVIEHRLLEMGAEFVREIKQSDMIFGSPNNLDKQHKIVEGGIAPRIRQESGRTTLEFKKINREEGGFEITANLTNIDEGTELLHLLGFNEAFTIVKTRRCYDLAGYSVSIDEVDNLGFYVEIEKMIGDMDEAPRAKDYCLNILNTISKNLVVESKKYGDLIQERINNEN